MNTMSDRGSDDDFEVEEQVRCPLDNTNKVVRNLRKIYDDHGLEARHCPKCNQSHNHATRSRVCVAEELEPAFRWESTDPEGQGTHGYNSLEKRHFFKRETIRHLHLHSGRTQEVPPCVDRALARLFPLGSYQHFNQLRGQRRMQANRAGFAGRVPPRNFGARGGP